MVDKYGATEVRYMYPGESQQIIEDANRYDFSVEYVDVTMWHASGFAMGNTEAGHFKITGFISNAVTEKDPTIFTRNSDFYNERRTYYYINNEIYNGGNAPLHLFNFSFSESTPNIRYTDNWWLRQNHIRTYRPRILANNSGNLQRLRKQVLNLWTQEITSIYSQPEITYWLPADGIPVWTLHIYQDDTEVFSRTEVNKQPIQLFVKTSECQLNTCPVDCGNKICCYRSDGIATEYFTK